ncbi:sodium:solute symporter [Saccharopolyspora shandongensis]|uniref:sodium:solute symporter family protein n=1 Tax=Saccharopolyspora shandongensis TaxID=418495 RepID=UPI0033C3757C
MNGTTTVVAVGVVTAASTLAMLRPRTGPPASTATGTDLEQWALAGRSHGPLMLWCVLGGTIYTAYTFLAVPGVVFSSGGIGLYALVYTTIVYPLVLVVLPRLAETARRHGYVSAVDFIRGTYRSPGLALAVALTGILATMPYIALQLIGIQAVLAVVGIDPGGLVGDLALTVVFAVLAASTYRHGLSAPSAVAVLKAALVVGSAIVLVLLVSGRTDWADLWPAAESALRSRGLEATLNPENAMAYGSLALGSALALFAFPHVLMVTFSGRTKRVVAQTIPALLGWTLVLGVFAVMGAAAIAIGVAPPPGRADQAVALLIQQVAPPWLAGGLLGSLVVAALVPAAVMSIGAATLFARNVYVEYLNPAATSEQEACVARSMSLLVKVGALAFALGFHNTNAIQLHLLGAVWVLQTLPALLLGLLPATPGRTALLAGWLTGMLGGTAMVTWGHFAPTVTVHFGDLHLTLFAGLLALAANLAVVGAVQAATRLLAKVPEQRRALM